MNGKSKLTLVATLIFLVILIGPLFFVQMAQAGIHQAAWYRTVDGVFDVDYYSLYPYKRNEVDIGFSEFGELISYDPTTGARQGLLYDTRDPFAPREGAAATIPSGWLQGWFIDIKYRHPTWGMREIWAFALFSDFSEHGNDWLRITTGTNTWQEYPPIADPGSGAGGRKTNGFASSDDIVVLYHGPRRYVALLVTHIYDMKDAVQKHLVDVKITLIFNKDKKEVLLLKDIKLIDPEIQLKIQFSNRAKWHLGPVPGYPSYAHFYHDLDTCYGQEFHTHTINAPHKYDLAQIISADTPTPKYVGWMAFWPNLTDWDVDGIDRFLRPLTTVDTTPGWPAETNTYVQRDDMVAPPTPAEPDIPWVIGEWIFWLDATHMQYRAVTVYGVTDYHDAVDLEWGTPTVDKEVMFQLDEVFNPWDLYDVVHKDTRRWVYIETLTAPEDTFLLPESPLEIIGTASTPYGLVGIPPVWDEYCSFAERVLVNDVLQVPARAGGLNYELLIDPVTRKGAVLFAAPLPVGTRLKILYSTLPEDTYTYTHVFGPYTYNGSVTEAAPYTGTTFLDVDTWTDCIGVTHTVAIRDEVLAENLTYVGIGETLVDLENASLGTDFKIPQKETKIKIIDVFYDANDTLIALNGTMIFTHTITAPNDTPIQMEQAGLIFMNHTVLYDDTTKTLNFTVTIGVAFAISQKSMGRYEWLIVGRDSAAVDSAGAAMVSEAFDSIKQIRVVKSGLDMKDTIWGPRVPFMMNETRPGTGTVEVRPGTFQPSRANYRDAIFKSCSGRSALLDDWCTTIPIASSNIITIGSPWSNHLTEYFNEFTDAYLDVGYGEDGSVMGAYPGKIVPLSCWNKTRYIPDDPNADGKYDDQTVGYAVVSTYKDLNGTVGFVIEGWTGQDTFFATEWFQEEGIEQLQEALFDCVTTIILKITYVKAGIKVHPPTVSVVECLGTISERKIDTKGGIHVDP